MSQKPSLPQVSLFVSGALMPDTVGSATPEGKDEGVPSCRFFHNQDGSIGSMLIKFGVIGLELVLKRESS